MTWWNFFLTSTNFEVISIRGGRFLEVKAYFLGSVCPSTLHLASNPVALQKPLEASLHPFGDRWTQRFPSSCQSCLPFNQGQVSSWNCFNPAFSGTFPEPFPSCMTSLRGLNLGCFYFSSLNGCCNLSEPFHITWFSHKTKQKEKSEAYCDEGSQWSCLLRWLKIL